MLSLFSSQPEEQYLEQTALLHRKQFGQYFTPFPIAQLMARWVTDNPFCKTILDPAVGLAVFFRAILQNNKPSYHFVGYDLDPTLLEQSRHLLQSFPISLVLHPEDYLSSSWSQCYDAILCNPPYLKFHHYLKRLQLLKLVQEQLQLQLSGLTNLYSLFLIKSISQLNPYGRAAYLVPSEFLNANFGHPIKEYLLQSQTLRYVLLFDFRTAVFENVITTSCILLFAKEAQKHSVQFISLRSLEELKDIEKGLGLYPQKHPQSKIFAFSSLQSRLKWRHYYQVPFSTVKNRLVPLSYYGKVSRGIATGANDYFLFNKSKQKEYQIPSNDLLPCISKSASCVSPFFTPKHFEELAQKDKNVYLFQATSLLNQKIIKYIELGESLGVSGKYLTRHRVPWYRQETRSIAPIWVAPFSRGRLKWIRNETQTIHLTTFHGFYPKNLEGTQLDILFAYLLTEVGQTILRENRREYGKGLEKFEPNDLNEAQVFSIETLSSDLQETILALYQQYREKMIHRSLKAKSTVLSEELVQLNDIFFKLLQ